MYTTTITQFGNNKAVIIPSLIMRKAKWRRGQKMTIDYVPEADGIFIRPAKKTISSHSRPQEEFQKWLDAFLKEDGKLLDELAER